MNKIALKGLNIEEIAQFLVSIGEPKYRAKQLAEWIFQRNCADFQQMTNLPQALRAKLAELAEIDHLTIKQQQVAAAGDTVKYLFMLADGEQIESVLMIHPVKDGGTRLTVCISTQVGCAMRCAFCATGMGGLQRNLTVAEIINQILTIEANLPCQGGLPAKVDNIVLMGMGEPLLNYRAVIQAVRIMNVPDGLGIGARHITISTCGVVPGILQLAQEGLQVVLAVSLHAPDDKLRNQLVPVNRKYPLAELISACKEYIKVTGRRITFEYILIDGVNDQPSQARALCRLLHGILCNVNLIPLNPVDPKYRRPAAGQVNRFKEILTDGGITATIREEKGADIAAACGQLRRRNQT